MNEIEVLTYQRCSYLHHLNGKLSYLDQSQLLFKKVIQDIYTLVIKGELTDLDNDLFKIIKKHIGNYYPNMTVDDAQTTFTYIISGVHAFIKKFSLEKYSPVLIDYQVSIHLGAKLDLNFDLIFQQNNKTKFIHAFCFVPALDKHNVEYNLFNDIKLKFLSHLYAHKRATHPPVKLHLVYMPKLNFRNKNLKTFPMRFKTLHEKMIKNSHLKKLKDLILKIEDTKDPLPIFSCNWNSCPKRQECINDYN